MGPSRYKVTISRENQPAHQLAEQSMALDGDMLVHMIRFLSEMYENRSLSSWIKEGGDGPFNPGTFKSLTITRVDDGAGS